MTGRLWGPKLFNKKMAGYLVFETRLMLDRDLGGKFRNACGVSGENYGEKIFQCEDDGDN